MNMFIFTDARLVRDPETGIFANGTHWTRYTIAVANDKGEQKADFFQVTSTGRQAENDAKYLKKGYLVDVSGEIRSWYIQESKKSGFNFMADKVTYKRGNTAAKPANDSEPQSQPMPPANDEQAWLSEYAKASQGQ